MKIPREYLRAGTTADLRRARVSTLHPLQAVRCPCGLPAWINVQQINKRRRRILMACKACGRESEWEFIAKEGIDKPLTLIDCKRRASTLKTLARKLVRE